MKRAKLPATTVYYGLEFLLSMPAFVVTAVYLVRVVHMTPLQLVLVGTVMESAVFVFEVGVERVGNVFLRGTRIAYAGALLGLVASVGLALWSLPAAVIAGGLLTIACGVASALLMPETGFVRRPAEHRGRALRAVAEAAIEGARHIRGRQLLLLLLAAEFFTGMSSEAFDRLWEAHFIRDIGLPRVGSLDPVVWFGAFGACVLLVGLVASTVLIRRAESLVGGTAARVTRVLVPLTAVLAVAELVFALSGSIALALGALVVARLARSLAGPLYLTWLNRGIADSGVRATVISMSGQADAIGQTAGGPVLGLLGNVYGIRVALAAGAAVLLPALGLYSRAAAREHL